MNPSLIAILVVVLAGGATALQAPTNAKLATAVASPVNAAFISFAVGTTWYAWLGGVYGACFVVAAAWGVPRLGVAMTITLMVGGQLLLSLILDHFGALGVPRQPLNLGLIAGVGLVLAGVLLVRRS